MPGFSILMTFGECASNVVSFELCFEWWVLLLLPAAMRIGDVRTECGSSKDFISYS